MTSLQFGCLAAMLAIGMFSIAFFVADNWGRMERRHRILWGAWLVFWLGPPLYFIWTKGVLG